MNWRLKTQWWLAPAGGITMVPSATSLARRATSSRYSGMTTLWSTRSVVGMYHPLSNGWVGCGFKGHSTTAGNPVLCSEAMPWVGVLELPVKGSSEMHSFLYFVGTYSFKVLKSCFLSLSMPKTASNQVSSSIKTITPISSRMDCTKLGGKSHLF